MYDIYDINANTSLLQLFIVVPYNIALDKFIINSNIILSNIMIVI